MGISVRILGDVAVFGIVGEDLTRTAFAVPTLYDLVRAQLETGKRKILVNFEKAEFVDSTGIGQIISSFTSTQKLGGAYKLCCVAQKLLLILIVVGLVPHVIKVFPDEAAALASFANPATPES